MRNGWNIEPFIGHPHGDQDIERGLMAPLKGGNGFHGFGRVVTRRDVGFEPVVFPQPIEVAPGQGNVGRHHEELACAKTYWR